MNPMILQLDDMRIFGIAACVPANALANSERLAQSTGIVTRRLVAHGESVVDLCVNAAKRVIADTKVAPTDFSAVVFVSFTNLDRMPCAAAVVQSKLGLPRDIVAFDVSLACSGWSYGLYLAGNLARVTGGKVLLLDGDVQSRFVNTDDVNTASLLADGGTATIVGAGDDHWNFKFAVDGNKREVLELAEGGKIKMNGMEVFKFVATDVVADIRDFLSATNRSVADFDAFVPHQPNAYMVRQLARELEFAAEKAVISCDRFGNLSSASIPVSIAAKGSRGKLLIAGFGGGLSTAVCSVVIDDDCSLSLMEIK